MLVPDPIRAYKLNFSDLDIKTSRGSGPGGQHRNRTESCVTITHIPTGTSVRVDMRSQHQSKDTALKILAAKLADIQQSSGYEKLNSKRREQVGSGQRGDKIRTYREQDNTVKDHRTGSSWQFDRWRRGDW